jgi:hypothetical protein
MIEQMYRNNRFTLFLLACIPARFFMAYFAYRFPSPILGLIVAPVALNWLFGPHRQIGFFGGPIWWKHLRSVHALMYINFAIFSFLRIPSAYVWLLLDVVIALLAGVINHLGSENDQEKKLTFSFTK